MPKATRIRSVIFHKIVKYFRKPIDLQMIYVKIKLQKTTEIKYFIRIGDKSYGKEI